MDNQDKQHIVVTLISNLEGAKKANLFVTINKKQTPVPSNLLWDLYEIVDPNNMGIISKYVKNLNIDGPLKDLIKIPRVRSEEAYLSFSSMCFVAKNELFGRYRTNILVITKAFFETYP